MRTPLSVTLQHTYLEVVASNQVTGKIRFDSKFSCWYEGMIYAHENFLISLPSNITCFVYTCYLEPSFLFFLLNLSKLYALPTKFNAILFPSRFHKPSLGNFPVGACSVCTNKNSNNLFSQLPLSALPSSYFYLLGR